ncbi:MAG: hypothetical protein LBB89_05250 [Treponema sp.]|jgi:hypothetical protein|nr:hypothetical protein [Treponema sp.]
MKLLVRTWNINQWKKRWGNNEKCSVEMGWWINMGQSIINREFNNLNQNVKKIWLLQEASQDIFNDKYGIFYMPLYSNCNWGNVIISNFNEHFQYNSDGTPFYYFDYGMGLLLTKCNFNKINVLVINIHNKMMEYIKNDSERQNIEYYKTLKQKTIPFIKNIINSNCNDLIIIAGDFNMNRNFSHIGIFNKYIGNDLFDYLEEDFIDCIKTKYNNENERSTMVDYNMQNDYIFVNKQFYDNINIDNININKFECKVFSDHFPIDVEVNI